MALDSSSRDRRCGAMLGLAIGDALGAAVEFESPGTFPEVTGYRGGGPHGLDPGEWTDDTSMALALADSIADVGWDLNDQADGTLPGGRKGSTRSTAALRHRHHHRPGARAIPGNRRSRTSGDPSERASGNGSIMRLAPVPMAYVRLFPDQLDELVDRLVESSRPTHASPQCLSACAYFGVILCGLIHGMPREQVLDPRWEPAGRVPSDFRSIPRSSRSRRAASGRSNRRRSSAPATW